MALGSRSGVDGVPGAADHALALEPDTTDTLAACVAALPAGAGVVVVGGGLSGIEAAAELREARPEVKVLLVSRAPLLADWSDRGRTHVPGSLARLGVLLETGPAVRAVEPGQLLTDQGERPFDLCLWTAGQRP